MSEERHNRLDHAANTVKALTWAFAITFALMVGYLAVVSSYELQQLRGVAVDTQRNSDRLVDCTTPGGKCYEQGRSTTSGAIGTINKVTIAAVYCSGKLGPTATIAQLSTCVEAMVR